MNTFCKRILRLAAWLPLVVLGLAPCSSFALGVSVIGGNGSVGGQASGELIPGLLRTDVGYLRTGHAHARANLYSGDLMLAPRTVFIHPEIGVRYRYQDTRFGNGGGLGLGGALYFDVLPKLLEVGGYGFYTPNGLTHGRMRKSYEYGVQARVHAIGKLYVNIGYGISRSYFDHRGGHNLFNGPMFSASMGF